MIIKNCLNRKRTAAGTVLSIIVIVIILLVGFSAFQKVFKDSTEFEDELLAFQYRSYEKKQEQLTLLGNPFTQDNHLNITIVNIGDVHSAVIWIMVLDPVDNNPLYGYYKLDPPLGLDPGEKTEPLRLNETWVFPGGYNETKNYIIQMITERGTVTDYLFPDPSRFNIKGGTELLIHGPFIFEFSDSAFTFTSREHRTNLPAWEMMDSEDRITFYIVLKNNSEETVTMNGYSYLSLVVPDQPISNFYEVEIPFYIIGESSEQDFLVPYDPSTPIVIEPGETIALKFASSDPLGSSYNQNNCLRANNDGGTENLVTSFLVLFWEYGDSGETFGLTIPFVSIHLLEY